MLAHSRRGDSRRARLPDCWPGDWTGKALKKCLTKRSVWHKSAPPAAQRNVASYAVNPELNDRVDLIGLCDV